MKIELESTAQDKRGRILTPLNITLKDACLAEDAVLVDETYGGVKDCWFRNILN